MTERGPQAPDQAGEFDHLAAADVESGAEAAYGGRDDHRQHAGTLAVGTRTILAPPIARVRATVLAVEASTLALAAGIILALALATVLRGRGAAPLLNPALWLALAFALLGAAGSFLATTLALGERGGERRLRHGGHILALCGLMLAVPTAMAVYGSRSDGDFDTATRWLLLATAPAVVSLGAIAWRTQIAIIESSTPLSELMQPSAQALLAGFGAVLLVGLVDGRMSAELTYELGAGTTMAALWAISTTGRVLRGIRQDLNALRREGVRLPPVERHFRNAAMAAILGLLVPSLLIVADLATARLTGIVLAGAALVIVGHPLRYTLSLCRLEASIRPKDAIK